MQNKGKQMLAVWGSPGSGKTITAVKLAIFSDQRTIQGCYPFFSLRRFL
jgi:predicted NACHT family NTPase